MMGNSQWSKRTMPIFCLVMLLVSAAAKAGNAPVARRPSELVIDAPAMDERGGFVVAGVEVVERIHSRQGRHDDGG